MTCYEVVEAGNVIPVETNSVGDTISDDEYQDDDADIDEIDAVVGDTASIEETAAPTENDAAVTDNTDNITGLDGYTVEGGTVKVVGIAAKYKKTYKKVTIPETVKGTDGVYKVDRKSVV